MVFIFLKYSSQSLLYLLRHFFIDSVTKIVKTRVSVGTFQLLWRKVLFHVLSYVRLKRIVKYPN